MRLTILAMPTRIELYEQMHGLSAAMASAARENDWDRLVSLEREVSALRDELMNNAGAADMDSIETLSKDRQCGLIRQILAHDAEIRRHTEPWMEQVRQFLGNQRSRQRVERAYATAGDGYNDSSAGG